MPAIGGLHQAGVTGNPGILEAPCLKFGHHLALVHVGVQTAVGNAVTVDIIAVSSMLVGQSAEAFLGLVTGQILVQNVLSLHLSLCPGFLRSHSIAVGIGGIDFGHDQNVAHVHILVFLGDAVFRSFCLMLLEVSFQSGIRGVELLAQTGVVLVAQVVIGHILHIVLDLRTGAHVVNHHFLGIGKAVRQCAFVHALFQRCQIVRGFLIHLEGCQLCFSGHGTVVAPGADGIAKEELLPGTAFHNTADLGIQGLGVIQTEVHGIRAVLLQEGLNLQPVVNLQLCVGQFIVTGGCHNGIHGGDDFLIGDGVAALAGFVIGIAVSGNGSGNGFFRCRSGGFLGRNRGIVCLAAHAAGHQTDQQRHQNHNSHYRNSDLTGGSLLFFLDFHSSFFRGFCHGFFHHSSLLGSHNFFHSLFAVILAADRAEISVFRHLRLTIFANFH